ncbi:DUF1506 family protein (plasmid) [Borreliella spielmanii]
MRGGCLVSGVRKRLADMSVRMINVFKDPAL